MSYAASFSPDYFTARDRFRGSAHAVKARLESHAIAATGPAAEELTVDVAILGDEAPRRVVVVSSATHGVEGYLGSAIQSAFLEGRATRQPVPEGCAMVLVHAVNPYGFAHTRRVNEDNIDLNRNFLCSDQAYEGSPDGYAELNDLLNPPGPPRALDLFLFKAAINLLRHGLPALKQSVASGQYDFPKGVFFGGDGPSESQRILRENLPRWVGDAAEEVLHVDFHTGLGERATYKLMIDHGWGSERLKWLADRFGADVVEPWEPEKGVSYEIRGGLGTWCHELFEGRSYDVLAAEFGTTHILRVIQSLVRENQAHLHGEAGSDSTLKAKRELKEVFAPSDARWRSETCEKGLAILDQASAACFGDQSSS